MTHVYLVWEPQGRASLERYPSILVAFPDLHKFDGHTNRRMMLDSGAFAAWNSGRVVDLLELAAAIRRLGWSESVALDVIGDWQASKTNAIKMRLMGSPAMPVFHVGDPWELLDFYCEHWPKVGLGGMVGATGRGRAVGMRMWLDRVFARAWPHRFHAFGQTGADILFRYPFHSADSSSWAVPVLRNRDYVHVRGAKVGKAYGTTRSCAAKVLCYNVERYAELGTRLAAHWQTELRQARAQAPYEGD